jgi:hypothetical protein
VNTYGLPMYFYLLATDAYTDVGGRERLEQVFEDTECTEKKYENSLFI